jgi:hypothetical protein
MLKPTFDYLPKSRAANIIFWIVVTLVLGALGSGLWENVFSPIFSFFGRLLVTGFTYLSVSYSDSLHRRISRDGIHTLNLMPFLVVSSLSLFIPWAIVYQTHYLLRKYEGRKHLEIPERDAKKSTEKIDYGRKFGRLRLIALLSAIVSTFVYGHESYLATYTRSAAVFVERSLDILAPSLSEVERLGLKARYRAMENASDFSLLYDELKQQSEKHSIKLPEFKPILRPAKL